MRKKVILAIVVILGILIADQVLKIYIKTNFQIGESVNLINGLGELNFIENSGMAFGMSLFKGLTGKIILSVFRFVAIGGLIYYLVVLIKKQEKTLYIVCLSMIIAGAMGNFLDSAFYGLIFDTGTVYSPELGAWLSYDGVSQFSNNGYSDFLTGCVVDMFHFTTKWPSWIPNLGGKEIFPAIFNIADSAITISVFILIIYFLLQIKKNI